MYSGGVRKIPRQAGLVLRSRVDLAMGYYLLGAVAYRRRSPGHEHSVEMIVAAVSLDTAGRLR
jgi:hypothetical protein